MKKVLSLVLSLVMLLSLVVPVSAEDTYPGSGDLAGKTAAFTIEADDTTLYDNGGEQIVKFHIYVESKDNVPIRAFQFTLKPSANLTLATELAENSSFSYGYMNTDTLIKSTTNVDGMYSRFEYTPDSRFFGAAGTDEGKGITEKTEIMTIMGKVNGVGDYTLSMSGVVAGNGNALNNIADKFNCTVAGATVTVKPESEQPQPNLSLALSTDKVKVGDTFTATLSNKGMNIISIIAQMRFNKDVLEVVSITENEGYTTLASGAAVKVRPTVDEANTNGVVGMSIANTAESWYPAKDIVTVTFKAKAAGEGWFELYESTDGTDGCESDISGGAVTVSAAAHVHSLVATPAVAATETAPGNSAYWTCSGCGKYFSDAEGKNEVVKDSWVIPATGTKGTVYLLPSAKSVCPGQMFTVKVMARDLPGVAGFAIRIAFDNTRLEAVKNGRSWTKYDENVSILKNNVTVYVDESAYNVSYSHAENGYENSGELFEIKFKVKEDAPVGDAILTMDTATVGDEGEKNVWTNAELQAYNPAYQNTSVATGHSYSEDWKSDASGHWHICSNCEQQQPDSAAKHTLKTKNDGDTHSVVCTTCGYTVETAVHSSSKGWQKNGTAHWKVCDACGAEFARSAHKATGGHVATCVAAAICDDCGLTFGVVDTENHQWSDGIVTPSTSAVRGKIRFTCQRDESHTKIENAPAYDANALRIEFSTVERIYAGRVATVDVSLKNNRGVAGMALHFAYDDTYMTLIDIQEVGGMTGWILNKDAAMVSYANAADFTEDGAILRLTFKVADNAPAGAIRVSVEYQEQGVSNAARKEVDCMQSVGYVKVIDWLAGDVNGDYSVNTIDTVTLLQYFAKVPGVTIDRTAADVNGDGVVNTIDSVTLLQYFAKVPGVELIYKKGA